MAEAVSEALHNLRKEIDGCTDCTLDGFDLCPRHSNQLQQVRPVVGENGWVEEIKEVIYSTDRPVSTVEDIAGDMGVSRETVRRNVEDVAHDPTINTRVVGQARIFWVDKDDTGDTPHAQYIPPDVFKRALERGQSVPEYLRGLMTIEYALEDFGFEKPD